MLFQTTAAHEELRAKIRSFAEEEIKPLAFLMDQNNEFPEEAVKKLGKLGWMGIPYPKEYGGAGLDALSYAIAVEELARVDGGTGVILSAHVSLGSWPIFAYGTEEQKKKYLVPLAKGEKIGAFGLTEPNAGSDAGGTETTALDKGDYYLLNGGKIFITNANQVKRSIALSGSLVPRRFLAIVDRFGSDPAAMKQAGIAYATDQIIDLIANGVNHVHIYTMNKPDVAGAILENLSDIYVRD